MTLKSWVRFRFDQGNRPGDRAKEVSLWLANKFWVFWPILAKYARIMGIFFGTRYWITADYGENGVPGYPAGWNFLFRGLSGRSWVSLAGSAIVRPVKKSW